MSAAPRPIRTLAVSSSVMQVAIIGGPALGGFLYALGGAVTYAVALVLLLVAIAAAANIRLRPVAASKAPVTFASVFAGVGFIFRHKVVLGAMSLDRGAWLVVRLAFLADVLTCPSRAASSRYQSSRAY